MEKTKRKNKRAERKGNAAACPETAAKRTRGTPYVDIDSQSTIVTTLSPERVDRALPEPARYRKPRRRRRRRPSFDRENQTAHCVEPGDDDAADAGGRVNGDDGQILKPTINRKGRPKGSKNNNTSASHRCERRSFACAVTGSAVCKPCGRQYDGDPLAHCLEYHDTVCPICERACEPPLAAHIKSHGTPAVPSMTVTYYECYDCKEKFGDAATMAAHVLDEHAAADCPAGRRECALCGARADDRTAAVDHLVDAHCARKTFSRPTAYRCRACRANFKSQANVLRHACNKIKSPYCERCDKTFPSKMRYAFHLQFHADHTAGAPMHLYCDLCLTEFDDEYQLYDHIRFRHELNDKAVCEVCGRTFKSSMGLHIHRRYHNGSRNFSCKSCDKSFLNKSTLKEHEISHMDVKPFRCHICGQYLSRASRLRSHVKTHKAAESTEQWCRRCGVCGFVAPGAATFADHANKERHHGPGDAVQLKSVVKCEFCDATYLNAAYLNEHRTAAHGRAADDPEAFVCVVCSSTFCTYSRLTTHKLTHGINMESTLADNDDADADRKPDAFRVPQFFSCQYCAKMCLHYTYFCLHRRLKHPPVVQSYECARCSTTFKTSWRLSYHKKTVHSQPANAEKPSETFACTMCSRKFVKIGALNLHKTRTHIDVAGDARKHLCYRCGKFFSSEYSLRNHAKSHADNTSGGRGTDDQPATAQSPRRRQRCKTPKKWTAAAASVDVANQDDKADDNDTKAPSSLFKNEQVGEIIPRDESTTTAAAALPPVGDGAYVCVLCDERTESWAKMKYHMNNHVIFDEILLCQTCYVPFLSSAALHTHVATLCASQPASNRPSNRSAVSLPPAPPPPLVVDCSTIFKTSPSASITQPPPLVVECSTIFKTSPSASVTQPPPPTEMSLAVDVKSPPPSPVNDDKSSVLDELLAIISTPSTSTTIDVPPPDQLNDILSTISSSFEEDR